NLAGGGVVSAGTLRLAAGASLTAQPGSTPDSTISGNLRVEGAGVSLDFGARLVVTGAYTQTAGSTTLGTAAQPGTLTVGGLLDLEGGTLTGSGTINGDVRNAGTISLVDRLTLTGDYTQTAAGTLAVTVRPADQYDRFQALTVGGAATLGGTLRLLTPQPPEFGTWFQPVAARACVGTFSALAGLEGVFSLFYVRHDPVLPAGFVLLA